MAVTEFGAQTNALPTPSSAEAPMNQNNAASVYMMPASHSSAAMTEPKPNTHSSHGLVRSAKGPTNGEPRPAAAAMGTIIRPASAEVTPRPLRHHIMTGSIRDATAHTMTEIEEAPSE